MRCCVMGEGSVHGGPACRACPPPPRSRPPTPTGKSSLANGATRAGDLPARAVVAKACGAIDLMKVWRMVNRHPLQELFCKGGGVWVGGSKALDPHPSYNSEGFLGWAPVTPSFFGHRSLVWLFAGALFCFVVVQVAGVQVAVFQMGDLFF